MATTPVVPAHREVHFKDEGRDVLADVLADPNRQAISGDSGTYFEPQTQEAPPPAETPAEPPKEAPKEAAPVVEAPKTPPPAETPAAPEPALYAGKFKTPEDLAKGYEELQKSFTVKAQEAATARKALEEREKAAPPTPEETEAQRLERINQMLADPDKYFAEQARKANEAVLAEAQAAREVAAKVEAWRETNKDVVPYEDYIGVVMHRFTAADPNLDPMAALEKATTAVREEVGKIREQGRLEALAVQGSVTQISAAKVNTPPPTEQPSQAPVSEKSAFDAHMASLRSQAASVRRPVR